MTNSNTVPIWQKINLTVNEAAELSNIGINRIYELLKTPNCDFVLHVGAKQLIKRKKFEQYLETVFEVGS